MALHPAEGEAFLVAVCKLACCHGKRLVDVEGCGNVHELAVLFAAVSEPGKHNVGLLVEQAHLLDLTASLGHVLLVDADGVCPEAKAGWIPVREVFCPRFSDVAKRGGEVLRDRDNLAIDDNALDDGCISPDIRESGEDKLVLERGNGELA